MFVAPVLPSLHYRMVSDLFGCAFSSFVCWAQQVGGLTPVYYGPDASQLLQPKGKGSKLIISNHLSFTDTFVLNSLSTSAGEASGMRAFAKASLRALPVLGWAAYFLDFVFLTRNYQRDQKTITTQIAALSEHSQHYSSGNFWLTIFPEGTRSRPAKIIESQAYAKSQGLPAFEHLLLPRTKGLQSLLEGADSSFRQAADHVLDITLGYPSKRADPASSKVRPSVGDLFFSTGRSWPVHIHVRAIPLSSVPTGKEELRSWVFSVFQEKDKLLEYYYQHGKFPGDVQVLPQSSRLGFIANVAFFMGLAVLIGVVLRCLASILIS